MIRIFAPSAGESSYQAIVAGSELLDYQCVTLEGLKDRLYCVGPRLQGDGLIRMSVFRADSEGGSSQTVFETEYYFTDAPVPTVSTPVVPNIYGGGFTWPDRFDRAEVQRESESSRALQPLSLLLALIPFGYLISARRARKHLTPIPEFDPVQ